MDDTVILVTRGGLGTTRPEDEGFGVEMLEKLFHTLEKVSRKPKAICFYTEGVRCITDREFPIMTQAGARGPVPPAS